MSERTEALKYLSELRLLVESKEVTPLMVTAFVREHFQRVAATKAFQYIAFVPALLPPLEVNVFLSDCDRTLLLQHLEEQVLMVISAFRCLISLKEANIYSAPISPESGRGGVVG